MLKVKTDTGDILEVTPNEAHDLIERGKAKLYRGKKDSRRTTPSGIILSKSTASFYDHRQMRAGHRSVKVKKFSRSKKK